MKFKDKIVMVTCGVRDIGRAISVKLAAEDATVVLNYYKSDEQTTDTLNTIHLTGVNLDITSGLFFS